MDPFTCIEEEDEEGTSGDPKEDFNFEDIEEEKRD